MNYGKMFGVAVAAAAISAVMVAGPADAKRVKWKLHSAWGSSVPHLGPSGVRWAKNIGRMSGGKLAERVYGMTMVMKTCAAPLRGN